MKFIVSSLLAFTLFSSFAQASCITNYNYSDLFGSGHSVKTFLKSKGYDVKHNDTVLDRYYDFDYSIFVESYVTDSGDCRLLVTRGYVGANGENLMDYFVKRRPHSGLFCPYKEMLKEIAEEFPACGE